MVLLRRLALELIRGTVCSACWFRGRLTFLGVGVVVWLGWVLVDGLVLLYYHVHEAFVD
jgi:hypothetical protein